MDIAFLTDSDIMKVCTFPMFAAFRGHNVTNAIAMDNSSHVHMVEAEIDDRHKPFHTNYRKYIMTPNCQQQRCRTWASLSSRSSGV
jgi:hypothetical protein